MEPPVAVVTEVDVCTIAMVAGEAAIGVGTIETLRGVEVAVFCDFVADCGSFDCGGLTGPAPQLLVFVRVRVAEPSTSGSKASLSLSGATGVDMLAGASSSLLAASRGLVRVGLAVLDLGFAVGVFGGVLAIVTGGRAFGGVIAAGVGISGCSGAGTSVSSSSRSESNATSSSSLMKPSSISPVPSMSCCSATSVSSIASGSASAGSAGVEFADSESYPRS